MITNQISLTTQEAMTVQAAMSILQKKLQLQEKGAAVSTAVPARKGTKRGVEQALENRRKRFAKRK